jgi:chromosome segregation ATPase
MNQLYEFELWKVILPWGLFGIMVILEIIRFKDTLAIMDERDIYHAQAADLKQEKDAAKEQVESLLVDLNETATAKNRAQSESRELSAALEESGRKTQGLEHRLITTQDEIRRLRMEGEAIKASFKDPGKPRIRAKRPKIKPKAGKKKKVKKPIAKVKLGH